LTGSDVVLAEEAVPSSRSLDSRQACGGNFGPSGGPVVRVFAECRQEILEHGAQEYPWECCGLLLGQQGAPGRPHLVRRTARAENAWPVPTRRGDRFLLAPRDLLRAGRQAQQAGLEILGTYHSHPDRPPRPSHRDLRHVDFGCLHAILSVWQGLADEVTWWRPEGGVWGGNLVQEVLEPLG